MVLEPRSRGREDSLGTRLMVQSSIRKETPAKLICYISLLVDVSLLEKETAKITEFPVEISVH